MANSKYEYVKQYEHDETLLRDCYLVCRVDGRSFHKFSSDHKFSKPNDDRALALMNRCAEEVMKQFSDIFIAIGMSDEFSFVFRKETTLFGRRNNKINSSVVSYFTGHYVLHWSEYMGDTPLQYVPSFDSRLVCYPNETALRHYLSWRQVDCHINNLYNTCFWNMVAAGDSEVKAANILKDTDSGGKNEILFSQFNINYNTLPAMHRKGTILVRTKVPQEVLTPTGETHIRMKNTVITTHEDLISDAFWIKYQLIPLPPPTPEHKHDDTDEENKQESSSSSRNNKHRPRPEGAKPKTKKNKTQRHGSKAANEEETSENAETASDVPKLPAEPCLFMADAPPQ
eukprot:TRINITY_DN3250_c0_g1_i2.p1 TRINITY_DN3250_c0_g1~~TRINITY_DN3250_c0_g1_i2.p1  ORF type:complete len:342 (+),score=52.17 TRINITY_DN3250_c0_g1_i2:43-1068(+)